MVCEYWHFSKSLDIEFLYSQTIMFLNTAIMVVEWWRRRSSKNIVHVTIN